MNYYDRTRPQVVNGVDLRRLREGCSFFMEDGEPTLRINSADGYDIEMRFHDGNVDRGIWSATKAGFASVIVSKGGERQSAEFVSRDAACELVNAIDSAQMAGKMFLFEPFGYSLGARLMTADLRANMDLFDDYPVSTYKDIHQRGVMLSDDVNFAGCEFKNMDLAAYCNHMDGLDLRGAHFVDCTMPHFVSGCDMMVSTFDRCEFNMCSMKDCSLVGDFDNCRFNDVFFDGTLPIGCNFDNCVGRDVNLWGEPGEKGKSSFDMSHTYVSNCHFYDVRIDSDVFDGGYLSLKDTLVDKVTFEGRDTDVFVAEMWNNIPVGQIEGEPVIIGAEYGHLKDDLAGMKQMSLYDGVRKELFGDTPAKSPDFEEEVIMNELYNRYAFNRGTDSQIGRPGKVRNMMVDGYDIDGQFLSYLKCDSMSFTNCRFSGSMRESRFYNNHFENCVFDDVRVDKCNFDYALVEDCKYGSAHFTGSDFEGAEIHGLAPYVDIRSGRYADDAELVATDCSFRWAWLDSDLKRQATSYWCSFDDVTWTDSQGERLDAGNAREDNRLNVAPEAADELTGDEIDTSPIHVGGGDDFGNMSEYGDFDV